jgi:hypothetical protein
MGSFGSSRHGNCIAFGYQSQLQAEKALCHNPVQLSPTVLCGVVRLTPSLRASMDWNGAGGNGNGSGGDTLFGSHHDSSAGLQEKDILLYSLDDDDEDRTRRRLRDKNVCEQVLAWWFGWE